MSDSRESELSFLDHLEELRIRIIHIILYLVAGFILAYVFNNQMLRIIISPLSEIQQKPVFVTPVEPFFATLKIAFFSGFLIVLPLIIFEAYLFVKPALSAFQSRALSYSLVISIFLFYSGILAAYFFIIPAGLKILTSFGKDYLVPFITMNHYLTFFIWMSIVLGIIFQTPVIVFFLGITELISLKNFKLNYN